MIYLRKILIYPLVTFTKTLHVKLLTCVSNNLTTTDIDKFINIKSNFIVNQSFSFRYLLFFIMEQKKRGTKSVERSFHDRVGKILLTPLCYLWL